MVWYYLDRWLMQRMYHIILLHKFNKTQTNKQKTNKNTKHDQISHSNMKSKEVLVIDIKIKVEPWFCESQNMFSHICSHLAVSLAILFKSDYLLSLVNLIHVRAKDPVTILVTKMLRLYTLSLTICWQNNILSLATIIPYFWWLLSLKNPISDTFFFQLEAQRSIKS